MDWTIIPYAGIGPLKFGMTPDAVETLIGSARKIRTTEEDQARTEFRSVELPKLHYGAGGLDEISFGFRSSGIKLDALEYFTTEPQHFVFYVRHLDPDIKLSPGGSIISFFLGISFDDNEIDDVDKGITAFAHGRFDTLIALCKPFCN